MNLRRLVLVLPTLVACNTPFIPIPPPADPTFTPVVTSDAMGGMKTLWEARGEPSAAMAGARLFLFDRELGAGVIVVAAADGSYVAPPIEAKLGDRIDLYYEKPSGEKSPRVCRVLEQGLSRRPCD